MDNLVFFPAYSKFLDLIPHEDTGDGCAFDLEERTDEVKTQFHIYPYDLKNEFEDLHSRNRNEFEIPVTEFSIGKQTSIQTTDISYKDISIRQRTSRNDYLRIVRKLKEHIHRGDIYEVNYCVEFFAENVSIDPFGVFQKLSSISEAPFSFYAKINDVHILCASPERFIKKRGTRLISQPIKGTRRRSDDPVVDDLLKKELAGDIKERTENIMIVDLVRNDLSRIAKKASVEVEELCEIYSFRQVHQMISTIACETDRSLDEIIRATFPMGSMTGAPKIRAMEISDELEEFNRGLYSGAAGVIIPNGDFDLNVMIRSIFYNENTGYLSFSVGSAITDAADPAREYDECLVKARAMFAALGCEDQWTKLKDEASKG